MKDVVLVYGTRPEALKLGPVAFELRELGIEPKIVATGQHSDLLRGTPAETDLKDSYSLGIRSDGDVKGWVDEAILRIASALPSQNAIVVVQGDTMSAYATALAASDLGLTLVHLEAGVRSHCWTDPDPEERFRVEIAMMADVHLAPTETARRNLVREKAHGEIIVTGNTVVSALQRYATFEPCEAENQIIVTMHRREFLDLGQEHVRAVFKQLERWALQRPDTRILVPMHPALRRTLKPSIKHVPRNVLYTPPLAYAEMVKQLRRSRAILTDSGGLTEEAATLGVPTAVLRNAMDRPEAIEAGIARLFPPNPDGIDAAMAWIEGEKPPRVPSRCFGGPESARNAANALKQRI